MTAPTSEPADRTAQRLWMTKELWALHCQAYKAGMHDMAINAYRAHFDMVERVAKVQRPDLWAA